MMLTYQHQKLFNLHLLVICLSLLPLNSNAAENTKGLEVGINQKRESVNSSKAIHQQVKVNKDCADCPEMIFIPEGSFDMGSPSYDAEHNSEEGPLHHVNVSAFLLGKTHVTRAQFEVFVKATKYDAGNKCWIFDQTWQERTGVSWRNPGFDQEDNHPVTCINWYDAKAYADWLSRKTGKQYRLPTEPEWEYAAKAGSTSARYWGGSPDQACGHANVGDQKLKSQVYGVTWETHDCDDGYAYTSPVGSFKPNAFGLYDMQGNLWQWVSDSWTENYDDAPSDSTTLIDKGTYRVLRGGAWSIGPQNIRSAERIQSEASDRVNSDGFRVARTLP